MIRPAMLGGSARIAARGLFMIVGAGLLASGCARKAEPRVEAPSAAVQTAVLAAATEPAMTEAIGTLRSAREATIAGKVMGTVTEIRKRAGDPVREGEILAVIDSRDVAGQMMQAEGALAQTRAAATLAETNFHRFEQLAERGAASALELDQARYQFQTAQGAVKQAEGAVATASSYQAYARIPAPFSGRVVDRLCEEGDLAAPGRPLLKIEDIGHLRLFASLEASRAGAAVVGAGVQVRVPEAGAKVFTGTISEVTPAADPATRSVLVKIDLTEDPLLRAGLFGRALLPGGERQTLRVPGRAVVRRGSMTGVFVDDGGHAALRMVTLNADDPERPEVLSGLSAGDRVVLDPPAGLEIGTKLEVRS
jgi:membrane fusion protein, multidrug efflux system